MPPQEALRALRRKLGSMSVRPSLLYQLMGFGHFKEMAMTREGWLIAWPHRSVGFDAFLGSVTPEERDQSARLWLELDANERRLVLDRLEAQDIPPHRVGIELPERNATRGDRSLPGGRSAAEAAARLRAAAR